MSGDITIFFVQSIYIRVKRANQTVFLYAEPSDSVGDVKNKLFHINKVPVENLRLIFNNSPLEDNKTLGDYKIENDAIVLLVYKKEGMLFKVDYYNLICVHIEVQYSCAFQFVLTNGSIHYLRAICVSVHFPYPHISSSHLHDP